MKARVSSRLPAQVKTSVCNVYKINLIAQIPSLSVCAFGCNKIASSSPSTATISTSTTLTILEINAPTLTSNMVNIYVQSLYYRHFGVVYKTICSLPPSLFFVCVRVQAFIVTHKRKKKQILLFIKLLMAILCAIYTIHYTGYVIEVLTHHSDSLDFDCFFSFFKF